MAIMADRIITIIDDDGISTRLGKPADEHVKTLPIKPPIENNFVAEVIRKTLKHKPLPDKEG